MRRTAILVMMACGGGGGSELVGDRWIEADAVFHEDPRWLGGEGGVSIDLGGDRSLWLFGDTFIADDAANPTRRASTLVHNSYGVMTGGDPTTATMAMHWPLAADIGDDWLRPISAVQLPSGELAVFLVQYRSGPGPGTTVVGTRVLHDPLGKAIVSGLISDHVVGAGATITDDKSVIALSIDEASHGNFVTFGADLETVAWADSDAIFRDVPADCTLRHGDIPGWWTLEYANRDGVLAYRTAPEVTGPWSTALPVWRAPDELRRDATIYSAFLHPMTIDGAGISATFVDRPADASALLDPAREQSVFWPHFLQVGFEMAVE